MRTSSAPAHLAGVCQGSSAPQYLRGFLPREDVGLLNQSLEQGEAKLLTEHWICTVERGMEVCVGYVGV